MGPFILTALVCVGTVLFLPGKILTMGAGFAFREAYSSTWLAVTIGSISTFIGAEIGAVLALLIGRYII